MSSDSDWRKMLRVISGGVGRDILKEERDHQKEEYPVDRSLLSIKDWDAEFMFRNMINSRDLSDRGRKLIELAHSRFRQKEMTSFLQTNQDSLSTWAVMDQGDPENKGNSFRDITHFIWHFKYDLGPWMQGKLVEIIGPMRSGKNNFAVYMARAALAHKIHVITSFPMFFPAVQDGSLREYYTEAHGLRDALLYMIQVRYREPEAIFYLMLDEQTTRGASNMRSNSTEAEWANGWIVRSGHFGCTTIRLMQSGENTIKSQKNLRYIEIYKNPRNINKAEGKFVSFGDEWPVVFNNIPDMTKYYNTASPGSWVWDVDSQAMNDYMALHEGEASGDTMKIYQFYERYIKILKKTDDPYWFTNKEYKALDREIGGNEEIPEHKENENHGDKAPLPVHHMKCPKTNGMIWTWTPKKYIPEGQWITCSKCKKGFKVHYSEDSSEEPDNAGPEMSEEEESPNNSDLMLEGYRGSDRGDDFGKNSGGEELDLNTHDEDLPDQKPEDPAMTHGNEAAEELAANAFKLFRDVVSDPEKMEAIRTDPELNARFKRLLNMKIPAVDMDNVARILKKEGQDVPEISDMASKKDKRPSKRRKPQKPGRR